MCQQKELAGYLSPVITAASAACFLTHHYSGSLINNTPILVVIITMYDIVLLVFCVPYNLD